MTLRSGLIRIGLVVSKPRLERTKLLEQEGEPGLCGTDEESPVDSLDVRGTG
jgi:hypothetical protein